jgi:hypothetical protein
MMQVSINLLLFHFSEMRCFSLRCDQLFSAAKKVGKNAVADLKIAKIQETPLKEKNSPSFVGLKQLFFLDAAFPKFLHAFS